MRIVVTGGLGFIGTSVVSRLISMDHEVIVVDYAEQLLKNYESQHLPILRKIYRNLDECLDVFEPYEFLARDISASAYIHLGACVDTRGVPDDLFEKNIRYVRALCENLPHAARIVYASSAAVYGTEGFPCNAYGMSKKIGENLFRSHDRLRTTALRFFNVYGQYEHHKGDMASVPFKLARSYKTKGRFSMFCPDASRDFISVDQVSAAVVGHAVVDPESIPSWDVYDVGTGINTTFDELDYSLKVLHGRQETACDIVPMPTNLSGHYQFYTKAGSRGTKISPHIPMRADIRDTLKEQFVVED